jgi:hypothetical protein
MLAVSQVLGPASSTPLLTLSFPPALSPQVINALVASPLAVDLRALSPHYYALAARLFELFEEEEMVDVLIQVRACESEPKASRRPIEGELQGELQGRRVERRDRTEPPPKRKRDHEMQGFLGGYSIEECLRGYSLTSIQTWRTRAAEIGDQAHNPRGTAAQGDGAGFLAGLEEGERQREWGFVLHVLDEKPWAPHG